MRRVRTLVHAYLKYVRLRRSLSESELRLVVKQALFGSTYEQRLICNAEDFGAFLKEFYASLFTSALTQRLRGTLTNLLTVSSRALYLSFDEKTRMATFMCQPVAAVTTVVGAPVFPTPPIGNQHEIKRFYMHPDSIPVARLLVFWCNFPRRCEILFHRIERSRLSKRAMKRSIRLWERQFVYAYKCLHSFFIGSIDNVQVSKLCVAPNRKRQ